MQQRCFVETSTENEQVLTPFLRSLMERGLDISEGVLVIVDGGKGLRAAVKRAFGNRALVQRCQWPAVLSWSRFLMVSSSAKCSKSVLDRAGSGE